MEAIYYTVSNINGDYAELVSDDGQKHSLTMFLLPEGTTVGSRLKLENFQWSLCGFSHRLFCQSLSLSHPRGSHDHSHC